MYTKIKKILLSTPFQLMSIILGVALFGEYMPHPLARTLYTISLCIKDLIMLILPLAIAAFIASTLSGFKEKAIYLVIAVVIFEGISNASSVLYAYCVALGVESWLPTFHEVTKQDFQLVPFFQLRIPQTIWWSTVGGVILGVVAGLLGSLSNNKALSQTIQHARTFAGFIFSRILARVMPFYVLGFMVFMQHSGLLENVVYTYGWIIALVTSLICVYLFGLLVLAAFCGKNGFFTNIVNILPTGLIAASTMSSAATMPYTIAAAEKNLRSGNFARMLIPATTNIQQVGDCIANAFLCLVILKSFGKPIPDLLAWMTFLTTFTLARYTTAAVIGGAIFLMIPIYQSTLGFTDEMIVLILALNVVLDPIITASNVLCNGALAIIFEKVWICLSGDAKPVKAAEQSATLTIEYPYTRDEASKQA